MCQTKAMVNKDLLNVLLITIDALRVDHLGCLKYGNTDTSNVDRLYESGILFLQAISQSSHTPESFPAILASIWPLKLKGSKFLPNEAVTIAEILKQAGYTTVAIHSNPYLSRAFNYHKGFDFFDDDLYLGSSRLSAFLKRATNYIKVRPHLTAEEMNDKTIAWLKKHGSSKFFLWLHYMDPHGPYQPPREYLAEFGISKHLSYRFMHRLWRRAKVNHSSVTEEERELLLKLYEAEIKYLDDQLGILFDKIKASGLFERTLIVITSDHGEAFGEHGKFDHPRQLYEENIHVPLLIICPSKLPAGKVISEQVRLIDLAPTIVDILNLDLNPNPFQGRSFLPLIRGEKNETPMVVSEVSGEDKEKNIKRFSVRGEGYKYIATFEAERITHEELYNLENDPKETHNIIEKEPDRAESFRMQLEEHIRQNHHGMVQFQAEQVTLNEEVKDRLKALGYIDD